jgi:hypothetical protein
VIRQMSVYVYRWKMEGGRFVEGTHSFLNAATYAYVGRGRRHHTLPAVIALEKDFQLPTPSIYLHDNSIYHLGSRRNIQLENKHSNVIKQIIR